MAAGAGNLDRGVLPKVEELTPITVVQSTRLAACLEPVEVAVLTSPGARLQGPSRDHVDRHCQRRDGRQGEQSVAVMMERK